MKNVLILFFLLFLSFQTRIYSQLADGSIAPNWTLTDIQGNTHTLYNLLDQGKMVVLEFSATWCGPCWNYMLTGALDNFWNNHGPNGANDAQVFYIESDWSTGMADLLGQTPSSQGNWVANIDFPIIDLAPGNNTAGQYDINYYPTLYAVCHDHTLYELGQVSSTTWANFIQSCNMVAVPNNIQAAVCAGQGSASVTATGGFMPYSYHWSNGANTQTISGLNGGTYHVTVTEGYGKIVQLDVVVPGATSPVSISGTSIDPALCFGSSTGNIYIDVNGGTPGYQYDWSNGSSSQDLHNVPAGTYTITIEDNHGCALTQSFTIATPDPIEATAETTPDNCDQGDGSITLDIDGGVGNYVVTSSDGTVIGHQIINLEAGNVTVEVTDENGCVWTDQIIVPIAEAPQLALVQGPDLSCIQLTTTISGYPSGGYGDFNYQWTTSDGHIISNSHLATITVDEAGTYQLQITDNFSGCQTVETQDVDNNAVLPQVEAGQLMEITCENLQVTLEGSGDPANIITWTTSDGHIVSGENTYHPIVDAAGEYHLHVLNPVTNCSNEDSMIVSNGMDPAQSLFNYNSSGLSIVGTNMSTGSNLSGWAWTFGDGGTSNEANVVHTYAAPGSYEVCLTVQNGCGVNQSCQTITVDFAAGVIFAEDSITNVLCYGESTGSIILNVSGGSGNYTYSWTGPDSNYSTPSLLDIPAGSYQLVLTDNVGNIFIHGYTVEQPSEIVLTGSSVVDNLCFGESNGSISLDITGGVAPYSYSWNGSAPQPENFIQNLPGDTIQAVVTDANGCVFLAGLYTIAQPDQLVLSELAVPLLCHGDTNGTISISVSGGVAPYSYSWFNGSQLTKLSGLSSGNFTVTVTDENGCIISKNIAVVEPDQIQSNPIVTNASALNQTDGAIELVIVGGISPYQVLWSNGATGTSIHDLAPGEYTYDITDANNCHFASPEPITVNFSTGVSEAAWPEYVTITPNPSKGNATIQWSELPYINATLSILNIDGKLMASKTMSSANGKWDLGSIGFTKGLYIILLKHNNLIYPYKLVVL